MEHQSKITPEETVFETGKKASYLRYDSLEELLSGMVEGLINQVPGDEEKGRKKLAALGTEAAEKIEEAAEIVARMWKISKPFMDNK